MDVKKIALIYSSIIATLSFLWNIYNEWEKRRGKLKIKLLTFYLFQERSIAGIPVEIKDLPPIIGVEIINRGKDIRYVDSVIFKTMFPVNKHRYYQIIPMDPNRYIKLPYRLEPGEKLQLKYTLIDFNRQLINASKSLWQRFNRVQVVVEDTFGKRHKSDWVPFKHFKIVEEVWKKKT